MLRRFADHVARSILARSPRNEDGAVLDLLCLAVFGALAGLSMGLWTGGVHLLYVATKVPLLLGGSLLIGFPSMLVLGRILGCPLGPGETARLALATVARTAVVLGALAPASAVFSVSLSSGGAGHYRTVVMVQVFDFTLAGLVGVSALHGRLGSLLPDRRARRRTVVLWVGIYSFVGAQVTWLLRPFLATPGLPLEYLRSYGPLGLESNFYVSVYRMVGGWFTG